MRCQACDCSLSDGETTAKSSVTKEYLDLCTKCKSYIDFDEQPTEQESEIDFDQTESSED